MSWCFWEAGKTISADVLPPRRRTDANNQINDVLSKLTALGTVLIPVRTLCLNLWGAQ